MKAVGSITVIFRCGELIYIYISASQKWSCRLSSFTECDPVALCHIRVIFTENNPTTARPFKVFFPAWVGSGDGVKYDTSELSSLTVFLQPRFKTCFLVDRARWAHLRRIAGITFSALHLLCCICFESFESKKKERTKNNPDQRCRFHPQACGCVGPELAESCSGVMLRFVFLVFHVSLQCQGVGGIIIVTMVTGFLLVYNSSSGDRSASSSSSSSSSSSYRLDARVQSTKVPDRSQRLQTTSLEGYSGVMDHKVNTDHLCPVNQVKSCYGR